MMLADLGAEIVKIEIPGRGDDTRQWGPPFAGGEAAYFLAVNRGKRSLTLNLKTEGGRRILQQLIDRADIVVENFRVGTMESWGLDYEVLRTRNPGLVYCAISGYGETGPYRSRPGYDFTIQAQGGIMSVTGPVEGPPTKVGVPIVDITAGLYASVAILAALHEREHSGQGQKIDIALFDCQIAWLANVASNYLISGEKPVRYGNAHPNIVPYESFPTSDGWIAVGIGNDRQWQQLCNLAAWEDLLTDPRFIDNPQRVKNRETLIPILCDRFQRRTTGDWEAVLLDAGIPCSRINAIDEVFSDPQALNRKMVVELPHPTADRVRLVGSPLKLSRTKVDISEAPPLLGQHTVDILQRHLGYEADDIERFRSDGVI
jgi:formyl-CoA transferase